MSKSSERKAKIFVFAWVAHWSNCTQAHNLKIVNLMFDCMFCNSFAMFFIRRILSRLENSMLLEKKFPSKLKIFTHKV